MRVSRDRHDVYVSLGESKRQDHAHGISGVAWLLAAVMGFKFARNFKFMPAGLGEWDHLSRMIWVKLMIARAISHAGVCDHGHVLLAQYCRPRGFQPHGIQGQAMISSILRLGADR